MADAANMLDKCPKCGADRFTYGTPGSYRTPVAEHKIDGLECTRRQLAALNEDRIQVKAQLRDAQADHADAVRQLAAANEARAKAEGALLSAIGIEAWAKQNGKKVVATMSALAATRMFAALMCKVFRDAGGVNVVEWGVVHEELGSLFMTIQRQDGQTPMELYAEQKQAREKAESDLRDRALGNGLAEAKEKADASQAVQEGETP